jgi:hypothetical protein
MKKANVIFLGLLLLALIVTTSLNADSKAEVEKVIQASYFNGAFNNLDIESMRKGFHPDFAIFSAKGNDISRFPIDVWIDGIEKRKQDPNFEKAQAKMDCKIASLDVTEGCAAAKIEISKNGKMVFTDYLSLLKFDDGWKIVAKVYHSHSKSN